MRPQRVGTYRRQLTLYDIPEASTDSWGQPSQSPSLIGGPFPMEVRPLKGAEMLNVRQMWANATHIIKTRWLGNAISSSTDNPNAWILPQMVLVDSLGSTYFHIEFAENVEMRNRQWILTCTEKVGAIA